MTYPQWLLVIFAAVWVACAIRPANRRVWLAENSFTALLVAVLVLTHGRYRLSDLSYTLVFVFLFLHTIGGHYTYRKVPYDRWFARLFGRKLNELLGLRRNHYDRLVHFCFGLLLAYPVWEVLTRHAQPRGAWGYVLTACVMMASSMLFELAEWAAAAVLGGDAGREYLAAQRDEWDAQKDMAAASLGAVIAMLVTAATP